MAQVRTRKRGKTYSYIFEAGVAAYSDFLHGNIGITGERVTVNDFISAWLQNVVAANVKPTTMQGYVSFFKNHVAPPLGNVKVQELTPALLDNRIRSLQQAGLVYGTLSVIRGFFPRLGLRRLSCAVDSSQSAELHQSPEESSAKHRQAHDNNA